jgi:hypothetical protein
MAETSAGTRAIIVSGRQLLAAVSDRNPVDRDVAVDALKRAATGATSMSFRFQAADVQRIANEQTPEERLTGALLDFQAANVLIAAGQLVHDDERNDHDAVTNGRAYLDTAVAKLQQVSDGITSTSTARFEFQNAAATSGPSAPPVTPHVFAANTKKAVTALIEDSSTVIDHALTQLKKLDPTYIVTALDKLGSAMPSLESARTLIKQGVEKLRAAYQAIVDLLPKEAIDAVRKKVKSLWDGVTSGKYSKTFLALVYDQDAIAAKADAISGLPQIDQTRLGQRDTQIASIAADFHGEAKMLTAIIDVIAFTMVIVTLTPLKVQGTLFACATYVGVLAALLALGSNSAGSRPVWHWGNGIGDIVAAVSD